MKWVLKTAGADGKGGVAITYGAFINTVISFIIVALVIFVLVKIVNNMHKKEAAAPAAPTDDVVLLSEIRDLLKKKQD